MNDENQFDFLLLVRAANETAAIERVNENMRKFNVSEARLSQLNERFSNDKLLSLGMPKPPRFTDYIARCVQTTQGMSIPQQMAVDFK